LPGKEKVKKTYFLGMKIMLGRHEVAAKLFDGAALVHALNPKNVTKHSRIMQKKCFALLIQAS